MKHTEQKSYFDGANIIKIPILRQNLRRTASESSENSSLKRPCLVPESPELLYNSFLRSIHDYIKATVDSTTKKSKNVERDLNKLEQKLLNIKTLPRGVLTQAAMYASFFKEYVKGNFHSIARNLREEVTEGKHDGTEPEVHSTDIEYRTCSVAVNRIIRKDLPLEIKQAVLEKLESTLTQVSDYIINITFIMNMVLLELRNCDMIIQGSFNIANILPDGFLPSQDCTIEHTIGPLPVADSFTKGFSMLMEHQHIGLIHSYYFDSVGAKETNLNKHPAQMAIFMALESSGIERGKFKETSLKSHEMVNALVDVTTNMKNMWSTPKIFYGLMNSLLDVLLRVHLAPNREAKYRSYIQKRTEERLKKDSQQSVDDNSRTSIFANLPRNARKNIVRDEEYKEKKHEAKIKRKSEEAHKWKAKVDTYQKRIDGYKMAVLARKVERSNIVRTESTVAEKSQLANLTRRRLRCLKSALKSLLLNDRKDAFSIDDLKKECYDVEEKEAYPCLLILNALKPYIPKKGRFVIAHQLPFCILANNALLYVGYKKFYRKFCPQPSGSTLHALRIDGSSLYQILTRLPCALAVFNYDNYLIESVEEARQNKDAVFSALFDMNAIIMTCKPNGLEFAQNITLLPGVKTAHLLGTKDAVGDPNNKKGPASYELTDHPIVEEESKNPKETLVQEIQGLQSEV
ncbi:uncharacterized protein RHIMIDRAFT_293945, partial [Rhizopus microsporus ATCC 52813]